MFRKIFASLFLILFISPTTVNAQALHTDKMVSLPSTETVDRDYAASGSTVIIDGTINGDAYIAGGNIEINGKINGDLLVAGGNITINGEITQDARVAGGNVVIKGKIGRNLSVAGGTISLDGSDPVSGNAWLAGGDLLIRKGVQKDLQVASGSTLVDTTVGGNFNTQTGELRLGKNLKVAGDLNYWSKAQTDVPTEASISGKVNFNQIQGQEETSKLIGNLSKSAFYFSLYTNILLFFLGWLFWRLVPNFSKRVIDNINESSLKTASIGIMSLVSVPVLFILLLVSVLGIPLAFFIIFYIWIVIFLSQIYIATWIGQKILGNFGYNDGVTNALLTGLVALFVLSLIPIVNLIVGLLSAVFGVGAIFKTKFDYFSQMKKEKLV